MRFARHGLTVLVFALAAPAYAINPILFVTQVPVPGDDVARMTVTSSFANHLPTTASAPRGGDLMARSASGVVCNITQAANYGSTGAGGFQDGNAIAVRDPAVHWNGTKAIFSMVVGAPTQPNGPENYVWQLYEVTNFLPGTPCPTPVITKVANQPPYNNIHPNYLSDGSIVFVSDRPRNGASVLYPIKDEYRGQPANSGVWKLDAQGGLTLLEHTPDGSFSPFVDSFGRLVFVRWDHLMQDNNNVAANGPYDYVSETSAQTQTAVDTYPEPIQSVAGSNLNGYEINQFIPWMTNQDGTREETLNHIGRHEFKIIVNKTYTNDPNLVVLNYTQPGAPPRTNQNSISNAFQVREDPTVAGRYLAVDAPEFGTHTSGQIIAFNAAQSGTLLNAHDMTIQYVNAQSLSNTFGSGIGHFRDPLPMSDGTLIASFASTYAAEPAPPPAVPNYHFRLTTLSKNQNANADAVNVGTLTGGFTKTVSYYVGPNLVTQTNAPLWELQPVEIRAHAAPPAQLEPALATPETNAFTAAGVLPSDMRQFLKDQGLALIVIRNVTSRDAADRQQPFNLHVAVPGGTTTLASPATGGLTYDLSWMQFFQADQVREYVSPPGGPGRRTQPRALNDVNSVRFNPPDSAAGGAGTGTQNVAADGSVALFVPARRALTWQTLSPTNVPVVRERYWVEFQTGEIRACDGCHGVNATNQAGAAAAANTPQALIDLLNWWKVHDDRIFAWNTGG